MEGPTHAGGAVGRWGGRESRTGRCCGKAFCSVSVAYMIHGLSFFENEKKQRGKSLETFVLPL